MAGFAGPYDSLVTGSTVGLFGRLMQDITLLADADIRRRTYEGPGKQTEEVTQQLRRASENNFLIDQLASEEAKLARIYTFAYQNELFDLAKPAIFLVHGEGVDPEGPDNTIQGSDQFHRRQAAYAARSGVSGQKASFAKEMRVWSYDRADFTMRLDMETGTFDRVLLGIEFSGLGPQDITRMAAADTGPPPQPGGTSGMVRSRRWRRQTDDY